MIFLKLMKLVISFGIEGREESNGSEVYIDDSILLIKYFIP